MTQSQETTTEVKEGAGLYDFDQLLGIETEAQEEESTEPNFQDVEELPQQEEQEQEEGSIAEQQETTEEEKKEVNTIEEAAKVSNNYSNLSKKYIEMGLWEDKAIKVGEEEVAISELEDLDEDTFLQITEAQENLKKEALSTNYINKDELNDISRQIVDISQNGGDITELLHIKESVINPLEKYDLDNETHQEALVRHMYAIENKSLSQKQINDLVSGHKKDMDLDLVAEKYAGKLKESYNEILRQKKEESQNAAQQEKENLKTLKKSLKQELSNLGMKDSQITALVESAVQKGENGFYVDEDFQKMKESATDFAEYLIWRNNPEEYRKKLIQATVTKRDVKQLELLDLAKNRGKKEHKQQEEKKTNIKEDFFSRIKAK